MPQIAIDDVDALQRPTQSHGALAQCVLTLRAFAVLQHLAGRRLPDVQICIASQLTRIDLLGETGIHMVASHDR
ncbi:MAG: hypothetical protein A3J28_15025 [Acidobacteria bacterium RIFCSPLOWO2_12_FULL_60_22]|nr:MAG: hypothetical protein A3J28_15025 [Acidobacteria bacterium RIFCSPLOWO2_12_FULL_60_22]